jgi:small subunit ribosomal protein S1
MQANNPDLGQDERDDAALDTEYTIADPSAEEIMSDMAEEDAVPAVDRDPEEEEDDGQPVDETQRIRRGTIVEGTVLDTSPTEVLVDLGEGVTGVIASRELERMDRSALELLQKGSAVTAYVLKAQGSDGRPVLSLARAEEELNWKMAEEYYHNQKVYFSKVAGYNKGGLIVRFGKVRGFVPASQISRDRQRRATGQSPEERWGGMVGEDVAVKVVEIDRARNRLILSERAAAREWREQQKSRLLDDLQVGEVRKGRVISMADFGAFVDLGGADGLVHLTEMSWKHITHPREVLEVGQTVEVQVISIDRERKRIGLSMKRSEDDPWEQVARRYHVGQLVQASVTKLTKFGAFARLIDAPEVEGLIHISELADYRVNHPRDVVLVGDVLTLRIVKIDREQRRLGLSLRQVDSQKFMDQDWQAIDGEEAEETPPAAQNDEPPAAENDEAPAAE